MHLINVSPDDNLHMCEAETSQAVQGSIQNLEHTWFLYSGCSRHMTSIKSLLTYFVEKDGPILVFGDNNEEVIMGVGTFERKEFKLKEVFYVMGLKSNLISIS